MTEAIERAEAAAAAGEPLGGTGFWKAVDRARRSRHLAEEFADRIAAVDRRSFESQVHLRVPVRAGNVGLGAGAGAGRRSAGSSRPPRTYPAE